MNPTMPKEPSDAVIAALCYNEWIGHPEAKPESIMRWRLAQRSLAREKYAAIRTALLIEQSGKEKV